MKKYNVFKVLLITMLVAIVFSFIIPQSSIGYEGIEKGLIHPITLIDSVSNLLTSFSVFISTFLYILVIGVLYALIKKTDKYDAIINNTAFKFKNARSIFLIISILTFGILPAVIGDVIPLLIFVPAFIDIAKKLGFDSKKAILSTVGAILIGNSASLYTYYTNQILSTTVSSNIIAKIIILVIALVALILYAVLGSKPEETKLEKVEVKKGLPISIAFDVIMVLLIIGMVPWNAYFGFTAFEDFHNFLLGLKVFDLSIYESIIATTLSPLGSWTVYSLIVLTLIVTIVLAIIYKVKINDLFEAFAKGIKKALPYAMILVIANMILVSVYNSGFYITVISALANMKDSILSTTTLSALSSVVYPDYTYANQFTLSTISYVITNTSMYNVFAIIFQAIYSLTLLISPTSVLILMALHYEDVRYKDWFKYIYKLFLGLLVVFFLIIIILGRKFIRPISIVVLVVLALIFVLLTVLCILNKNKTKKVPVKKEVKTEEKVEVKEEKKETPKKQNTKKSNSKKK